MYEGLYLLEKKSKSIHHNIPSRYKVNVIVLNVSN